VLRLPAAPPDVNRERVGRSSFFFVEAVPFAARDDSDRAANLAELDVRRELRSSYN
jgi:hypothetical protein